LKQYINLTTIFLFAFVGADRINFFGNPNSPFILTPFLVIGLFMIINLLIIGFQNINFSWFVEDRFFTLSFFSYLLCVFISIIFSLDPFMSSKRTILLLFIITVFVLLISYYDYQELLDLIVKASILGSFLFFIFNIILLMSWLDFFTFDNKIIDFQPDTIAYFLPRLGGYCSDANRSGFILTVFTFFLIYNRYKSKIINYIVILNILMIILSLSRTTYILFVLTTIIYLIFISKKGEIKYFFMIFSFPLVLLFYFLSTYDFGNLIDLESALSERFGDFSLSRFTSAGIHLRLIIEGFQLALSEIKILFFGIGQGVSHLVIKGYYWSGSKYGNFHSQYITILVENGFLALIAFLNITFLIPIIKYKRNFIFPLLFSLFFYNIFYQLSYEPLYWFLILFFYKSNQNIELSSK